MPTKRAVILIVIFSLALAYWLWPKAGIRPLPALQATLIKEVGGAPDFPLVISGNLDTYLFYFDTRDLSINLQGLQGATRQKAIRPNYIWSAALATSNTIYLLVLEDSGLGKFNTILYAFAENDLQKPDLLLSKGLLLPLKTDSSSSPRLIWQDQQLLIVWQEGSNLWQLSSVDGKNWQPPVLIIDRSPYGTILTYVQLTVGEDGQLAAGWYAYNDQGYNYLIVTGNHRKWQTYPLSIKVDLTNNPLLLQQKDNLYFVYCSSSNAAGGLTPDPLVGVRSTINFYRIAQHQAQLEPIYKTVIPGNCQQLSLIHSADHLLLTILTEKEVYLSQINDDFSYGRTDLLFAQPQAIILLPDAKLLNLTNTASYRFYQLISKNP